MALLAMAAVLSADFAARRFRRVPLSFPHPTTRWQSMGMVANNRIRAWNHYISRNLNRSMMT